MSKTTDTVFQLLAYGDRASLMRVKLSWKAEVYFDKVFSEILYVSHPNNGRHLARFEYRFHCGGFFYAQTNDLETSNALLNYAIAICSENHLTYYLARAAAQLAKNAQAAGEPASVILELIQDALAFCKNQQNRLLINELNQMKNSYNDA